MLDCVTNYYSVQPTVQYQAIRLGPHPCRPISHRNLMMSFLGVDVDLDDGRPLLAALTSKMLLYAYFLLLVLPCCIVSARLLSSEALLHRKEPMRIWFSPSWKIGPLTRRWRPSSKFPLASPPRWARRRRCSSSSSSGSLRARWETSCLNPNDSFAIEMSNLISKLKANKLSTRERLPLSAVRARLIFKKRFAIPHIAHYYRETL